MNEERGGNGRILPVGKLPPDLLEGILERCSGESKDVVVPPRAGEDAAVLRMGRRLIAVGADPITFPTPKPGFFAVHINANDIAVTGAAPQFYLLTLLLPPGTSAAEVYSIVDGALEAGRQVGATLVGGHTEVTGAVTTPVVSICMFGQLLRPEPLATGNGKPGDAVIQVNPLGIEGTAILAYEHEARLVEELGRELVSRALAFAETPGLSVVEPALLAASRLPVHAMHDPTEGGIATGLRELAGASRTGVRIDAGELIIAAETEAVCNACGVDPLGMISSGCLLMSVPEKHAGGCAAMLEEAGFTARRIGSLTDQEGQCRVVGSNGDEWDLPEFSVDELAGDVR
ncbi:MAG: hypothetical protein HN742_19740 [Lentisphaerae bacterium]|jgi:hydrogenase expression/formation protein HypE|nr:hypothetical protein [Lentisphaerota bacterium]MBT4820779.1 hypothetical protein [Lentisphaerota bacterium]MBT5610564.1 hypothetical protein [Lentisphaerota bacterium]MBT7060158.1 hypothetical protein [Lentisphaerota bacterium]MBT7844123.1 hypothetical protein [Lentisphaerota bacterium]